jgi:effector-binding domain-containing protein
MTSGAPHRRKDMSEMRVTGPGWVELDPTTTAVIGGVVPMDELPAFFDRAFSTLSAVLATQGVTPTGPAFARYHGPPAATADLEVGFPTDRPVTDDGEVRASSLPGGRVARLVHAGSFDELGRAWGELGAWIGAQGAAPGSVLWEVYVTEPSPDMDPADLRTELYWSPA